MANLNDKILLAHQVNGRWVIDEDTWKGNLPSPDYQIVTPQQAQQKLQENVGTLQSEINFFTAQHGAGAGTVTRRQGELAGLQQQINKFANYTPPATSGQQYTRDASGNLITKEALAGFVAPNAPTPQLTQAQLTAQNAARGITQTNLAPARTGTLVGATITPSSIQAGIANLKPPPNMTPAQQTAWNNAVSLIPKTSSITTSSLQGGGTPPVTIHSGTSNSSAADSTVAGANSTSKSIADYIKLLTPPESNKSTGVADLIASINTELEGLKGRGTAQLSEEERQGVVAKKQLLQNSQTELNQKLAEYKSIQAQYQKLQTDVEGKAVTMNSIIGSQAQIERAMRSELNAKSSEIAMIQANVSAAQGNLTLAQNAADRAVDLKYSDAKDAIDVRLKQLELLQGQLTKEEKIRSDAITLYLKQQSDALAVQKANEKDKNATLLNQMQTYPDAGITLNDTIESANQKITTNSKIYKNKTKDLAGGGGSGTNNAIDSGQPVVAPADPTKTTAQNNMQTLQQVFQSSKVSAGNKTSIGNGLALAQAAQDLADANIDGTFSGFSPFRAVTDIKIPFTNIGLPFREALKRNKTIQNESLISALDLQTQFWASGAALSDAQTALVKKMIPVVTDTDTQIRTKVNQLINYMLSQTSSRLITDGINFKPAKVDMFETVGLLDKASPEQLAELKAAGLTQ